LEVHRIAGTYFRRSDEFELIGDLMETNRLKQTRDEEKATDEKLTELAGSINLGAAESEDSEEGSHRSKKAKAVRA
jgi:hypothetical protein